MNEFFRQTLEEQQLLPHQVETRAEIDAAIEEHRLLAGAKKVHITLALGATGDSVREYFRRTREISDEYASFSELEHEKAKVARLSARLTKLTHITANTVAQLEKKIFDLDSDIQWMKLNREKNGRFGMYEEYKLFEE